MVVEVMKQTPKEKKFNHPSVRKVLSFKGPFIIPAMLCLKYSSVTKFSEMY